MSGLGLLTDYNYDSEASETEDKTGTPVEQKTKVNKIAVSYDSKIAYSLFWPNLVYGIPFNFNILEISDSAVLTAFVGSIKFTQILFLCLKPIQVGDIIQTINRKR